MGDGDTRRDRGAARVATSTAEPACEGCSATKDKDCDAGAECGVRDAAICRAMAVREEASRAPETEQVQGLRRGITHRFIELERCVVACLMAGRTAGGRVDFTCVAAA